MATEFTKRAAAELSRCFNGLNVNKNSSNKKPQASANGSATGQTTSNNNNQTEAKEAIIKNDLNNKDCKTMKSTNNIINNLNNSTSSQSSLSSTNSTSSNLFTLTNSVKSIGSAYEQNILAAKTALRSPFKEFKSPNKSSSTIVSNVISSFNGLDGGANSDNSNNNFKITSIVSPQTPRKQAPKAPPKTNRARLRNYLLSLRTSKVNTIEELWKDETFLKEYFFKHFSPMEKCRLAQVNSQWKNLLYDEKEIWRQLIPTIYFNELRKDYDTDADQKLYESLDRRRFRDLCIYAANDNDIERFCEKSKNFHFQILDRLELCCFKNCNITDKGLEDLLASANQLIKLEILSCNDITDSGIWTGCATNLHSLTIMDCINISDETVATIALLPQLKELTLQAYHVSDTGFSFFAISENDRTTNRVQIEILNLISCWEITNQTLNHIAQSMPNLKQLSLSGCSKISDDAVEIISEQLINLTHLDLSWCSHITSLSLEYLACELQDQLKSLVLDRCVHITDQALNYIATMTNLETLSLRWCPQIRDNGIQTISNMRSLKNLSIAGCPLVSASGIKCLIRLPVLKELEVTNCPFVTDDLLKYLKNHLPDCDIVYNG